MANRYVRIVQGLVTERSINRVIAYEQKRGGSVVAMDSSGSVAAELRTVLMFETEGDVPRDVFGENLEAEDATPSVSYPTDAKPQ